MAKPSMDSDALTLVQELHATSAMAAVAVAGAGTQAMSWLLSQAGASRTVLEIRVPYSSESLRDFLGHHPESAVSEATARDMARAAYRRALRLREDGEPVVGVACTATIATDRVKRGEHRCHVASWSADGLRAYSLRFVKGRRDRAGEDDLASRLVLRSMAEASGLEPKLTFDLGTDEPVEETHVRYRDPLEALMAEHVESATVLPDGTMRADAPVTGGLLPGSFNPLHEGHEELAEVASGMIDAPVTYELSVTNVDKPPLQEDEVRKRITQFAGKRPVVLTRAPVYYEKERLFPGCAFVIGWDTALRLVNPRYYGGEAFRMLAALDDIRDLGGRFLVAGRTFEGRFQTMDDVPLPKGFEDIFTAIPESVFRKDLSSTDVRLAERATRAP